MTSNNTDGVTARARLALCAVGGVLAGVGFALSGEVKFAALAAWDVTAILYVASTMVSVLPLGTVETKSHALRENPGRTVGDALLLLASSASLVAVGLLLVRAGHASGVERMLDIGLGLASVVISWAVIHTVYMLTYARLYYGHPEGGIEFNQQQKPRYSDFAYLAFTLGMTYQVSDTAINTKPIRSVALRHALLSYIFGTVIIAVTINFLAGLTK